MNEKLAIDGGTPVFQNLELAENIAGSGLIPQWPIPHKETEQKLLDIFRSGKWGGCGMYEQKLMTGFAEEHNARYAIWMCNGTTTLECALLALDIGPSDEVIVPAITWIATAEAAVYVGAKPVIVDVDINTMCMDPERFEAAITPRTKAVIPVHIYSAMSDMDKINAIAKKHGIHVIEDCAHAHGAKQHGIGAGSLSEIGSFSFQSTKLMTAGEGGCCTTSDDRLADRLFRLSHIGNSRMNPKQPLESGLTCHQYRFTEFQAAIIYDQLQHLKENREQRLKSVEILNEYTKDLPSIKMQASAYPDDVRGYYFFSYLVQPEFLKPGIDRKRVFDALWAEGLSLGTGWGCPLYKSAMWNVPADKYIKMDTANSEEIMYRRVMVAMHPFLMAERSVIEKAGEAIRKVMLSYTK